MTVDGLDGLGIRRVLGRSDWGPPVPWGDGWMLTRRDNTGRVIVSVASYPNRDGTPEHLWIHASMSYRDRMPEYADLKLLHQAVFGDRHAYQVFVPAAEHYNYHEFCLHLWGRVDGTPMLPDFAFEGGV